MSIDYQLIGRRIKNQRKQRSMTQEHLAERIGVSVGYISQIERGITRINLDTLSNISSELNCDVTEFLHETVPSDKNFLKGELASVFSSLNDSQRKILLEIANILKNS